jgi:hypothetical protein
MHSTKLKPASKAILLIDALMKNGAIYDIKDNNKRQLFLYSCQAGVDPTIIIDEGGNS